MITTSTFTKAAWDYIMHIPVVVVLIDGAKLAVLMIEYAVGVTHYRSIKLPQVEGDYFVDD
jgi:restriction system protein